MTRLFFYFLVSVCLVTIAPAAVKVYPFDNETQEIRFHSLLGELRCPKCQNQSLADSDAPIAQDLREKVYQLIKDGKSDQEIRQYLIDRYGQFITYRPPLQASTWLLWAGPGLILVIALWLAVLRVKRNTSSSAET